VPHRVVVGDRGLKEGKVEYQGRRDAQATPVRWPMWLRTCATCWPIDRRMTDL
jgi:hypothetical protein